MKVKNTQLPLERVSIDKKGNNVTVELWDGTYIETKEENNMGDLENVQKQTMYEYNIYLIDTKFRENLKESIEKDFNIWYIAAKQQEKAKVSQEIEKENMKEISDNLIDTLLDYDFRIMMLEELGSSELTNL